MGVYEKMLNFARGQRMTIVYQAYLNQSNIILNLSQSFEVGIEPT